MSEKQYGEQFPSPLVPPGNRTGDPNTRITPVIDPDEIAARDPRRGSVVGDYLNRILSQQEPELARFLVRRMGENSQEPTFNEIARAVANGEVEPRWLEKWRLNYVDAYSEYIRERMARAGRSAAGSIISSTQFRNPDLVESLFNRELDRWLDLRGADLVQDISRAERDGLRQFLRHFTFDRPANPRAVARYLRPVIGLTVNEAARVQNIIDQAREDGASDMEAMAIGERASLRSRRFRAERIARTELAFAFNYASLATMQMANEANEFPGTRIVKRWYTQLDERVCPWCGPLHDQIVEMDQTFPGATRRVPNVYAPPAHPMCRCVLMYDYIDDDSLEFDPDDESLQAEADAILAGEQDSGSPEEALAQPETAPAAPPDLAPTPVPEPEIPDTLSPVAGRSLSTPFVSSGGRKDPSLEMHIPDRRRLDNRETRVIAKREPGEGRNFKEGAYLSDVNGVTGVRHYRIGRFANSTVNNDYSDRHELLGDSPVPMDDGGVTLQMIDAVRDDILTDIETARIKMGLPDDSSGRAEAAMRIVENMAEPINDEVRERVELAIEYARSEDNNGRFVRLTTRFDRDVVECLRRQFTIEYNGLYCAKPEGFLEGDHPSDWAYSLTYQHSNTFAAAYKPQTGDIFINTRLEPPDGPMLNEGGRLKSLWHENTHRAMAFNGRWADAQMKLRERYFESDPIDELDGTQIGIKYRFDADDIGEPEGKLKGSAVLPRAYSKVLPRNNFSVTREYTRAALESGYPPAPFAIQQLPGAEQFTTISELFSPKDKYDDDWRREMYKETIAVMLENSPEYVTTYMGLLRGDFGWSPSLHHYQPKFVNAQVPDEVHVSAIYDEKYL